MALQSKVAIHSAVAALFIGALSMPAFAKPLALEAKPEKSQVEFLAIGKPSLLRIKGKGEGVNGGLKIDGGKASGDFTFDLSKLDTGIETRNNHMKEKYLQVDKFKEAKLTLQDVALPASFSIQSPPSEELPFSGTLNLHGVPKPVTGTFKLAKAQPDALGATAKFEIKLSDFAIEIPSYAGIKVADTVNVEVNLAELRAAPETK